ncbi:methyl-CpG-binding domain-containing protein 2 [Beta vulgaris subsp. vulgaris]|uniref:methyl-CpG-binding domain-containing protein 2 n=1 Tax=Beta vulgaris subsp. vulgaris TaxID=3555 RepID=UPI002036D68B|nr:methyl-CpG-binding domain-containing protein 2 [Beta vulgaris subsp. vulgaris]
MQNQTLKEQNEKPSINHVVLSSDDEEEQTQNDKQIVLYDPTTIGSVEADPIQCKPPLTLSRPDSNPVPQRVLPAVGAFTVQCAKCFKWRLIPTKEKYEEIRENILELPFSCDLAKEWRPEVSCDEAGDLEQDNSRLWAIDKPNIAQPPPGWERELRIRGEGCSKFADVYYIAPSGKRLRSMVEVQRYLLEHPEFAMQGVTLSQFSFRIPKPLKENYVRKRTARLPMPDETNFGMPGPRHLQTIEASPLSWAAPADPTPLQLSRPGLSADVTPPAKKKARQSTKHTHSSIPLQHTPHTFKINGPSLPPNGVYDL